MEIGKRILIVDDEPLSVTAAIDCLKDAGYKLKYVSNANQAWKILNNNPDSYDAVILDRLMPELDGITLLNKIKKSQKLHDIPVIIETAKEDSESYLAALEAGAYDLIYKPLEKNFLLYVVDNAVNDSEDNDYDILTN
jgi:DNA-binding NtrC family response regulator